MLTVILCVQPHISAKFGQIRDVKVSIDLGHPAGNICVHNITSAHKLTCMHPLFLQANAPNSAKFVQIGKIKASME